MKKTFIIISLLAAGFAANAQNAPALLIPSEPERLSMASSELSEARKALDGKALDAYVNYGIWSPSIVNNNLLGAGVSMEFSNLSFSFKGKYLSDREPGILYNEMGTPLGEFKSSDLSIELGAAYRIADKFSAGLSLRMLNSALTPDIKANAFMVDLSGAYRSGALDAHLSLGNLGTPLKYSTSTVSLPMYLMGGAGYEIADFARAEAELAYVFNGQFMASAGVELNYAKIAFLRAGYHYGGDKGLPSFASVGLGVQLMGIRLSACYLLASETLSGTMAFGLGYSF